MTDALTDSTAPLQWLTPEWPAPLTVRAATTLRTGGVSGGAFDSLNLGTHVGDELAAVLENRRRVRAALALPAEPCWLTQVHGTQVVRAQPSDSPATADAAIALAPGEVCAVLTADCLPVVFCDRAGRRVGAAHAGWRGLVGGVLQSTVSALGVPTQDLLAWLGPAIEPAAFEVGSEVREAFLASNSATSVAFEPNARGRWQADLYALARLALERLGVSAIYGGGERCFADRERFYSFRREAKTGRMATLIWLV